MKKECIFLLTRTLHSFSSRLEVEGSEHEKFLEHNGFCVFFLVRFALDLKCCSPCDVNNLTSKTVATDGTDWWVLAFWFW